MKEMYHSPYEAYPFLGEDSEDLRCDFEILTDQLASQTGLLRALCSEEDIRQELVQINTLIYHANPSLRTGVSITPEEIRWLQERTQHWQQRTQGRCEQFVLPQGSERGCVAHVLRTGCKQAVRMIYRFWQRGGRQEHLVLDFFSLLSGYFFMLALELNGRDGVEEIPFTSRNYIL